MCKVVIHANILLLVYFLVDAKTTYTNSGHRFKRITKDLKVTRVFSTLAEELRAMGITPIVDDNKCIEVMVP